MTARPKRKPLGVSTSSCLVARDMTCSGIFLLPALLVAYGPVGLFVAMRWPQQRRPIESSQPAPLPALSGPGATVAKAEPGGRNGA
ncbi:MAG TPA: hypothetical protein VJB57_05690 [Dehalococcoidia bacterium]|nr:hypothetical protein [Dehalococcoidia bacterium]